MIFYAAPTSFQSDPKILNNYKIIGFIRREPTNQPKFSKRTSHCLNNCLWGMNLCLYSLKSQRAEQSFISFTWFALYLKVVHFLSFTYLHEIFSLFIVKMLLHSEMLSLEFSGSPVVRAPHFHCMHSGDTGSIPGQGTKNPACPMTRPKKNQNKE